MAMQPSSGRSGTIWDPFFSGSVFEPFGSRWPGLPHSFGPPSIFDFPGGFGKDTGAVSATNVDWIETPDAHSIRADLPGMKKEEVKVEVLDGRTLRISGERNKEKVEEKDSWHCVERSYGKFSRRFGLPPDAKLDQVSAEMKNGVLTVTVPKIQTEARDVRSIEVKE